MRNANWSQENPYPDVASDSWYNSSVSVMTMLNVITGHDSGLFKPDDFITRAELAAVAARFAKLMNMGSNSDASYNDIAGHWAEADVLYVSSVGWLVGYPGGSFKPDQAITRAEFMAMVNRMLERMPETVEDILADDMIQWVDNSDPDAWYYLIVQEATNSHAADSKEGRMVPGIRFEYERWLGMMENPDWLALEQLWKSENSDN